MKVVRWIGAFGKTGSLHAALKWELTQTDRAELAAEPLVDGRSRIRHARIGLLVRRSAIVKIFDGDCWSVADDGRLKKTRNPRTANGDHQEAWVRPDYVAIVVKNWSGLPRSVRKTVAWFAGAHRLPVLDMCNSYKEVTGP